MKRFSILLVLGILLWNCQNSGRPQKPDNLISKDQMADILYDVFLLNAAKGVNKRLLENHGIMPEAFVYKKYKIDSLQFALSNDYYSYDTSVYESIIENVKIKLEVEKKSNDELILKEDRVRDSVRKSNVEKAKLDKNYSKQKIKVKSVD